MALSNLAGKPAPQNLLTDVAQLEREYFSNKPDPSQPTQKVAFGTSGHRGSSLNATYTESHILAITQAICDFRAVRGITGPLYLGRDTHALSAVSHSTTLEVLAANGVETFHQSNNGVTPTPVISHAIIQHNHSRKTGLADGIVITPSHNPPEDGGFKYNGVNGGPADTDVTRWIQDRANEILRQNLTAVKRMPESQAKSLATIHVHDFILPYVQDLQNVVDMNAIRSGRLNLGVDPLGGASLPYWDPIQSMYGLQIEIVNSKMDPAFGFMCVDHDGKIRMDCSSPYAMAGLLRLKDKFQVAFANDPDADRHGIVTPSTGLMNPNHYLAVSIQYLLTHRPQWGLGVGVGKTLVSSSMIDRVVQKLGRRLYEVPVGFKWFAPGLHDGTLAFGGEESAGASFLKRDGSAWSTDKDGIIMNLLAAEMTAVTGMDPGRHFKSLSREFGMPFYTRMDAVATPAQKARLSNLSATDVQATSMAGSAITAKMTKAAGNQASIGGLKVVTGDGWFAARPSGTENIYKIYAESFLSEHHLQVILKEAREIVDRALAPSP